VKLMGVVTSALAGSLARLIRKSAPERLASVV
jgi:hypothetical protein